jgi:glycosyltransferase 2 family protein
MILERLTSGAKARRFKALLRTLRVVFTPLALIFIVGIAVTEREALHDQVAGMPPRSVLLIILLFYLSHLSIALSNWFQFRAFGFGYAYTPVLDIYIARLPARYIPGGIWQTVSRSMDFISLGAPAKGVLAVMSTEVILSVSVATILGGVCFFAASLSSEALLTIFLVCSILGAISIPILSKTLRSAWPTFSFPDLLFAILSYSLVWLLYATGFWFFLSGLDDGRSWSESTGIFLVSWVVGFFSFFAPQGIGVFEATAGLMLADGNVPLLIATLFGFRVLAFAADVSLYAGYSCARRCFAGNRQTAWRRKLFRGTDNHA